MKTVDTNGDGYIDYSGMIMRLDQGLVPPK